jgi:tetratricopeptide (TPR) repeat protein
MQNVFSVGLLSATILVGGCSAYRVGSQIQAGRQDLLLGKSASAAGYFQEAANSDPDYERSIGYMREGVWTYLGRADYDAGKLPQARQALERAVAHDERDYFANLYLGLVLAKAEERGQSLRELKNGLAGLDEWFNYTTSNALYGQFWDPSGAIRSEIDADLAMISNSDIDWPKLVASAEWVGKKTEEEIDLARRDEQQQYDNHRNRLRMGQHR